MKLSHKALLKLINSPKLITPFDTITKLLTSDSISDADWEHLLKNKIKRKLLINWMITKIKKNPEFKNY